MTSMQMSKNDGFFDELRRNGFKKSSSRTATMKSGIGLSEAYLTFMRCSKSDLYNPPRET